MKITIFSTLALLSCFLQITPGYSEYKNLLDSWTNISTNYADDITQSNFIYFHIQEELNALNQLRTIVERHLKSKNAEFLVNVMNTNSTLSSNKQLKEIIDNIMDNYDDKLVDSILTEVMDEIILLRKLPDMPDILWKIYQNNDNRSFETMLRLQTSLYASYTKGHQNEEKEFLEKFSYRLHKIINEKLYKAMPLSLKSKVQNIVEKLPGHLKYLYFTPYFCLVNVKYETYIYTAVEAKVDKLSRYIWLWSNTKTMDDTGYIKAEEFDMDNENKLRVLLKGTKYQLYYYMMPSSKMVAGWDNFDTPFNHIWDVEFLRNGNVIFSQNDYLMCAIGLHDNERRNVGGKKKNSDLSANPECQWNLGKCAFE